MKIRNGFVSNSSSSSFTCDVCHNNVSGWDMGLDEAEMNECINGHTFCDSHKKKTVKLSVAQMAAVLVEKYDCDKKEVDDADEDGIREWYDDLINSGRYEVDEESCPVCAMTVGIPEDILKYVMIKFATKQNEILSEIKDKFSSYKEFKNYLKNTK